MFWGSPRNRYQIMNEISLLPLGFSLLTASYWIMERECWKFLDWRLNSDNDSRLHGQPSFSRPMSELLLAKKWYVAASISCWSSSHTAIPCPDDEELATSLIWVLVTSLLSSSPILFLCLVDWSWCGSWTKGIHTTAASQEYGSGQRIQMTYDCWMFHGCRFSFTGSGISWPSSHTLVGSYMLDLLLKNH